MPAIYTGAKLRPYRQWLPAASVEGTVSLEGSFETDNIQDYYCTPWDLGYGHLIKNPHDFIGKSALEAMTNQPHRKKVWLEWNNDDVRRTIGDALFNRENAPRLIDAVLVLSIPPHQVLVDDRPVGLSTYTAYTANKPAFHWAWSTKPMPPTAHRSSLCGRTEDGIQKPLLQPHVQTEIEQPCAQYLRQPDGML